MTHFDTTLLYLSKCFIKWQVKLEISIFKLPAFLFRIGDEIKKTSGTYRASLQLIPQQ